MLALCDANSSNPLEQINENGAQSLLFQFLVVHFTISPVLFVSLRNSTPQHGDFVIKLPFPLITVNDAILQ